MLKIFQVDRVEYIDLRKKRNLQLTYLKGIINTKKVLPIDGQPRLVFIKMTDLLAVGRLFLFMGIFTQHVAEAKNGCCVTKYTDQIQNRHGITPSYMYSGKPVSI